MIKTGVVENVCVYTVRNTEKYHCAAIYYGERLSNTKTIRIRRNDTGMSHNKSITNIRGSIRRYIAYLSERTNRNGKKVGFNIKEGIEIREQIL